MHDIVIRGGTVVDGTGAARFTADVAIDGERITAVGPVAERGRREIDADGLLVTPGLGRHPHPLRRPGHLGPELAPSSWHGVTTVVMGNCGVGFAPVGPAGESFLINLMEGVEDIPGTGARRGHRLGRGSPSPSTSTRSTAVPRAIDVGAQVPHAAAARLRDGRAGRRPRERSHAGRDRRDGPDRRRGHRGRRARLHDLAHHQPPGRRRPLHPEPAPRRRRADRHRRRPWARPASGVLAGHQRLRCPGRVRRCCAAWPRSSGRPLSFSLAQVDQEPELWRRLSTRSREANAEGLAMRAQVGTRPIGVLFGLEALDRPAAIAPRRTPTSPTSRSPSGSPQLAEPGVRERILADEPDRGPAPCSAMLRRTFELGDPPDYEPAPDQGIAARPGRAPGIAPGSSSTTCCSPTTATPCSTTRSRTTRRRPRAGARDAARPQHHAGLSDGGAHVGTICDASFPDLPAHPLGPRPRPRRAHPARAPGPACRPRPPPPPSACATAACSPRAAGRHERGRLRRPTSARPGLVHDLPTGGKRLLQRAEGYRHTFVAGTEVTTDGTWTGAPPGASSAAPKPPRAEPDTGFRRPRTGIRPLSKSQSPFSTAGQHREPPTTQAIAPDLRSAARCSSV